MQIRNRIKELRRVKASDLVPNPRNWHLHPAEQKQRMIGLLLEVGTVAAPITRLLPDGRLMLLDGHMRSDIAGDDEIAVLVTDLSEAEAAEVLATFDTIGRQAGEDSELLAQLAAEIEAEDAEVRRMLDELLAAAPAESALAPAAQGAPRRGPVEMELQPHEHYDYVIVLARNLQEWYRLTEMFDLPRVESKTRKVGLGHGILAEKLLRKFDDLRAIAEQAVALADEAEAKTSGEHSAQKPRKKVERKRQDAAIAGTQSP